MPWKGEEIAFTAPGKIAKHPASPGFAQLSHFEPGPGPSSRKMFGLSFQNSDLNLIQIALLFEIILPVDLHQHFRRLCASCNQTNPVTSLCAANLPTPFSPIGTRLNLGVGSPLSFCLSRLSVPGSSHTLETVSASIPYPAVLNDDLAACRVINTRHRNSCSWRIRIEGVLHQLEHSDAGSRMS